MLRWLYDTFCMLNSCLSSPVMRCEPPNYCRWVKAKNRNSVLCARVRESFFAGFSDLAPFGGVGGRTRWRPLAKSSPISRKNAQGLSRLLLLFSDGTALRERAQGRLGDCAALFLRGVRRALLPLPERLHTSGGARFAAERNSRCQELQPRRPSVFLSIFAISRASVPLFAFSFFEERAERGAIS